MKLTREQIELLESPKLVLHDVVMNGKLIMCILYDPSNTQYHIIPMTSKIVLEGSKSS